MAAILLRRLVLLLPLAALALCGPAYGEGYGMLAASPSALCRQAAAAAEQARHVPQAFLSAIARVESGRTDPATGQMGPWPWTVNAEGTGHFYDTKAAAVAAVLALQARGVRSIDVGCLQVNLLHHPDAFASLDMAFDPQANAAYAAGFLVALFGQMGSWPLAAAAYHSQTPTLGAPYEKLVLEAWAAPEDAAQARHGHRPVDPGAAPKPAPAAGSAAPAAAPAPGGVALTAIRPVGRAGGPMQPATPPGRVAAPMGRSLAAYRLAPTRLAWRPPGRG